MLTYGPNGISRGVATIIFNKPGSAKDALAQLNGVRVDNKPMRVRFIHFIIMKLWKLTCCQIEIVINAANAQVAPKGLGDRLTCVYVRPYTTRPMLKLRRQAKNQPKAAAAKPAANGAGARGGKEGRGRVRRGRNAGRPKAKSAEELDLEMVDYFDVNAQNATTAVNDGAAPTNGVAQPATNGEDLGGMDDIS